VSTFAISVWQRVEIRPDCPVCLQKRATAIGEATAQVIAAQVTVPYQGIKAVDDPKSG